MLYDEKTDTDRDTEQSVLDMCQDQGQDPIS
jgi:hypothetical protein